MGVMQHHPGLRFSRNLEQIQRGFSTTRCYSSDSTFWDAFSVNFDSFNSL